MISDRLPGTLVAVVVAIVATGAATVSPAVSPLVAAVALGAFVANLVTLPPSTAVGIAWATRSILRIGIVLLGFRLSVGDVVELGATGVVVVVFVVSATFLGTRWMARRLGVSSDLGLLIATGYSICGASAIAAVNGAVDADEDETAYAVALVTLCGTLSIAVLPAIGGALGLDAVTFGTWVGGAVHDVGQVVATATIAGDAAVESATVVKLTRVVLLAPLVATVVTARRREVSASERRANGDTAASPPLVPLFVVGFLSAIAIRSLDLVGDGVLDAVSTAEQATLTVALAAMGLGVRLDRLRRLGGRPLVLGLLAWILVAGVAGLGTALA